MATKRPAKATVPSITPASVSASQGITLLNKLIEKANSLIAQPTVEAADVDVWNNLARDYLVRTFGSDSPNINAVIYSGAGSFHMNMTDAEFSETYRDGMKTKVKHLEACIEQLETDLSLGQIIENPDKQADQADRLPTSSKVFVVHGRNAGAKESTARFLEKLDLEPVILHEKANSGRTIIEKFSDYSDVQFAVVLLTGDDEARLRGSSDELVPRARQNVMLELGYFLGRLGRARVCVLYERGVEIPSDYQGVLFVELDGYERWKLDLVKELKAAGFPVDANRAFG